MRRRRRRLTGLAASLCGVLAFVSFVSQGQSASTPRAVGTPLKSAEAKASSTVRGGPPAGSATSGGSFAGENQAGAGLLRSDPTLVAEGHALFLSSCSSCHGLRAEGIPERGPDLHGVGELAPDFYLETGRMPLSRPTQQPFETRPAFPQHDIHALTAYVGSFGGPPIPIVHPQAGSAAKGAELFALDCAGCHQIQARGGIVTGAVVPWLSNSTPTDVAEAIRIGPYVMPRFGSFEISEADVNSLARFIQTTQHPTNAGGWGIGRLGPIPEGMVTWLLGLAALVLLIRVIGERTTE